MVCDGNCGEMNKKWRTMVPGDADNSVMQMDGGTVNGSSFAGLGAHIRLSEKRR